MKTVALLLLFPVVATATCSTSYDPTCSAYGMINLVITDGWQNNAYQCSYVQVTPSYEPGTSNYIIAGRCETQIAHVTVHPYAPALQSTTADVWIEYNHQTAFEIIKCFIENSSQNYDSTLQEWDYNNWLYCDGVFNNSFEL